MSERRMLPSLDPRTGRVEGDGIEVTSAEELDAICVAADAAGVPRRVFVGWIRRGEGRGAREPWRSFARDKRCACWMARRSEFSGITSKSPGNEFPGRYR